MRPATAVTLVVPALLLAACATSGVPVQSDLAAERTGEPASEIAPATPPRPKRNVGLRDPITAADIARIDAASAYDAVVKLRANFLQHRGVNSFMQPVRSTRPVVFVDGMEVGTVFELRSIPARDVSEIRYLSSGEATIRYGDGYMAGVIQVTTKR